MDEPTTPAPDSAAQSIPIYNINPLISTGVDATVNTGDTMNRVATVLDALSCLAAVDGEYSDGYEYGMTLIHQWLAKTLEFATDHPNVKYVAATTGAAESEPAGGAS